MSADHIPGRSLVTKRAIRDLVRSAVQSVYGVTGMAGGGPAALFLERLGVAHPGLRIDLEPQLRVSLRLTVAYGLPIAEVARQVESSVRYTLRNALGKEPASVSIRIGALVHEHGTDPHAVPTQAATDQPGTADLAASGTDVA